MYLGNEKKAVSESSYFMSEDVIVMGV
jgi:hypothetical protein